MSKTVLLIESDTSFARDLASALESSGYGVRTSSEGKEGVELARALRPDCVVLCVELPGLSGYSWCNRLKKDEALKKIPLVITSSEATPETFEQHRKLKTRAEDYLIKPFSPSTLVERIGALIGAPAADEEELVGVADVELDGAPAGGQRPAEEDADLRMLDEAFDSISGGGADEPSTRAPGSPAAEPPLTLLPDADEAPATLDLDREMAEALAALAEEAATPARIAPPAPPPPVRLVEPTIDPAVEEEATPILLEDVEVLPAFDVTDASLVAGLQAAQEEARIHREDADRLRIAVEGWESQARARQGELDQARARLESSEGEVRSLAGELEAARDVARTAQARAAELEREVATLRPRLEEAERSATARGGEAMAAADRVGDLERALEVARSEASLLRTEGETLRARSEAQRVELDGLREESEALRLEAGTLRAAVDAGRSEAESLRAELSSLRGQMDAAAVEASTIREELEGARAAAAAIQAEAEARSGELARRLKEAQAQSAQHEDRVLRAYQKIKSDEKVREKTRKALAMVLQVLEDRSPGDGGTPPAAP